jgi:hypothetical protein
VRDFSVLRASSNEILCWFRGIKGGRSFSWQNVSMMPPRYRVALPGV